MRDARVVRAGHGVQHLEHEAAGFGRGQRALVLQHLPQRQARDELEHREDERAAHALVEQLHDVRMVEPGAGRDLAPEPLEKALVLVDADELQHHLLAGLAVGRGKHDAVGARADHVLQYVALHERVLRGEGVPDVPRVRSAETHAASPWRGGRPLTGDPPVAAGSRWMRCATGACPWSSGPAPRPVRTGAPAAIAAWT